MSENVIRGKKKEFVEIPNSVLQDPRLSMGAIGLFVVMKSFPDDWKLNVSELATRVRMGRATVRKYLKELEDARYLEAEPGEPAEE